MHNLYILRGAKVRDARIWSGFIDEARTRFAEAEVYFGSHHWPLWGQKKIQEFLAIQRDTYKFIHDQAVRPMNHGHTPREIARQEFEAAADMDAAEGRNSYRWLAELLNHLVFFRAG
jgi:alkyl sulfatase BDS1-like metallo-beta-lactamase superfamily hydrolase